MVETRRVTWTRKPSFLERVGKSISGILFGIAMFCLSFVVLYYNEGSSVNVRQMLEEVKQQVVPLQATKAPLFNDQLVYFTGFLDTDQKILDDVYGISFGCVKLKRVVEMYQWVEHSDVRDVDEGDEICHEVTYYYETEWSSSLQKSQSFSEELGHRNPKSFSFESYDYTANMVLVDEFQLLNLFVEQINWFEPVVSLPIPSDTKIKRYKHHYYHASDPTQPQVGDYRVSFQCAGTTQLTEHGLADQVSLIGKFLNGNFVPHITSNHYFVAFLYRGIKTQNEMLSIRHSHNNLTTWIIRFGGFVMMFVGLSIMTRIVVILVDWIPIVRGIVSASVTMFNLTLALFLSLVTIAVCWVRFHPWFATAMIGASLLPWFLSLQRASTL